MPKTKKTTARETSKRPPRKIERNTAKRRPGQPADAAAAAPVKAGSGAAIAPIRPSKKASLLALLEQPDGAAISDLTEATGWQGHNVVPP